MAYGSNNRKKITIGFILFVILVAIIIAVGYFFSLRLKNREIVLYVTVMPKVYDGNSFRYLETGGAYFTMTKNTQEDTFETDLQAEIEDEEKIVYSYTLNNSGEKTILYELEVVDDQDNNNCYYTYKIAENEELAYENTISGEVGKDTIVEILVFINITDNEQDCEIKGHIDLKVSAQ